MPTYISDKPFARYDGANFLFSTYSTDDPDKIERIENSRFYKRRFHKIEDLVPDKDLERMKDEYESSESNVSKYESMTWGELRSYASKNGIDINKKKRDEIVNELTSMEK
jgi:hypothetical protein